MSEENATPVNDGVVIETAPAETKPEVAAELAPASESGHEQTTAEVEFSDGATKAINKKHWQAKEAERQRDALQAELDTLKAGQQVAPAEAQVVPDAPDGFDDDYLEKLAARDDVIRRNAEIMAQAGYATQQAQTQQDEANRQQQAKNAEVRDAYAGRATGLGLEAEQVMTETAEIINFGISDAIYGMISTEADGPLLAHYLRQNPSELTAMQSMPVHQQVAHMTNVVRQGAESIKPKTSQAPPPPTDIRAGGALNEVDPLLEGLVITHR